MTVLKTILPQEVEVWYVLPAIRKALAEELVSLGLNQKQVALRLKVTEAAVSQYIKKKRASEVIFQREVKLAIKQSAENLKNDSELLTEMHKISTLIKSSDAICQIHKQFDKTIPKACEVCFV